MATVKLKIAELRKGDWTTGFSRCFRSIVPIR